MKNRPSKISSALAGLAALLFVAGCETTPLEPSPNFMGDMVINTDYAQFFRLGPQQAGGADLSLRTGECVMLQRKEFGYSRVQLEDGQVGYMANEDITPAPPEPRRKRGLQSATTSTEPGKRGKRSAQTYDDDLYEDIALPDPNLDIMPEDVPLEPLPDLLPSSVDKPERAPTKIPAPGPAPAPVREGLPESTQQDAPPVSTSM